MRKICGPKSAKLRLRKGVLPSIHPIAEDDVNYRQVAHNVKSTQTFIETRTTYTQCHSKLMPETLPANITSSSSSGSSPLQKKMKISNEYVMSVSETGSESPNIDPEIRKRSMQIQSFEVTMYHIERDPKYYLGLPLESYELVKILITNLKTQARDIYIVLKKISLDQEFKAISDDFGLSVSQTSYIFRITLYKLNEALKKFVFWPSRSEIEKNLPIPFRLRYRSVASIIDCFDIIIEKPKNPIHQALTWSGNKKNNTIKYLHPIRGAS